eukprot:CAMPEP_0179118582 /NCGR_PEP_ID=MMETSP0796-20121207/55777_1 /TAXON_ID=73915 /ORGANISM="Pyrodinium bahamense, Strain pbaha01" /LENGTH=404 /DNA_ID=CAMNT_0020817043 /DNA_START=156 /DNA_END=1368 /DNA_ORIENTATION=+
MMAMANQAGAPPQPMMYYYVTAMPGSNGQTYVQGAEGLPQASFEAQQVPAAFAMGQQPGYGYGDQDAAGMGGVNVAAQMGHMQPAMMPAGGGGNGMVPGQMMVLTTMMPQQQQPQQPQPQQVEQPQDTNQGQSGWGPALSQPQQPPAHEQPQQHSLAQTNRALKIVNPNTKEEIRPNEGRPMEPPGPVGALQPPPGPMSTGQQPPAGTASQQPTPVPWPPPAQFTAPPAAPQGNVQASGMQQGSTGGGCSPPASAATGQQSRKMKGLQNKKIEKPQPMTARPNDTQATASSTPAPPAPAPSADAPTPGAAATTAETAAPSPVPRRTSERTSAGGAATTGPSAMASLPRWPPAGGLSGGHSSNSFASSIKALNLEPMRANPQPFRGKPAILRPPPGTAAATAASA